MYPLLHKSVRMFIHILRAALAQLVRAPDCGSGGPWFETRRWYHSHPSFLSVLTGSLIRNFALKTEKSAYAGCLGLRSAEGAQVKAMDWTARSIAYSVFSRSTGVIARDG